MDEIADALKGNVVTDLEDLDQEENEFERKLNVPLYEIYAPLREFNTGKIIAVGEFYEMAASLEQEINRIRQAAACGTLVRHRVAGDADVAGVLSTARRQPSTAKWRCG